MTAPAWALRVGAVALSLATLGGSFDYAATHVKNPLAPLQPPVVDRPQALVEVDEETVETPSPEPTRAPTAPPTQARSAAPSARSTSAGRPTFVITPAPATPAPRTPAPTMALAPGVRATKLPAITYTHSS
jgi:hypothetical protein